MSACIHTHMFFYLSLFFHQVSDILMYPSDLKGTASLVPSLHLSAPIILSHLSLFVLPISVYYCACLLHINFRACIWVCTLVLSPFVFNCFQIIYLPLILYIACSAFWLPSNQFNVLSDEMQLVLKYGVVFYCFNTDTLEKPYCKIHIYINTF